MLVSSVRKFLQGGLSPAHVWMSVVLGVLLGMIPNYSASAGLVAIVLLGTALIRVNAGLFALSVIVSKSILLLSLPWLFALGHSALHGAAGSALQSLSQLPVLAWFGFERYATVGALLVAMPLAMVVAFAANNAVQKMRNAGAQLQTNAAFDAFAHTFLGRTSLTLLLGSSSKDGLGAALNKPVALFRWKEGLVGAALLLMIALAVWQWAKSDLKNLLVPILEQANGATVDVNELSLNSWNGTLDVTGLEVADPSDLSLNLFSASELRIAMSTTALLSKQVVVSEVSAREARSGMPRSEPGELVGPLVALEGLGEGSVISSPNAEDLGGYVNEAEQWLDRLKQAQSWLKKWEGSIPKSSDSANDIGSPSYQEWLEAQIAQSGYAGVSYAPIADRYWSTVAEKVSVDSVRVAAFAEKDLTLLLQNLASNPSQLAVSPSLKVASNDDSIGVSIQLDELRGAGENRIDLRFEGLDAQNTLSSLKSSIAERVRGGQINLGLNGTFRYAGDGELALDLLAELNDSELTIRRRKVPVAALDVPVRVQGSFARPSVRVDNRALEDQLKGVAEDTLKDEAKSRVEDKIRSKLGDRLKGLIK